MTTKMTSTPKPKPAAVLKQERIQALMNQRASIAVSVLPHLVSNDIPAKESAEKAVEIADAMMEALYAPKEK